MRPKNAICLWFDKDAHDAARFYAAAFPDSEVTGVHKAPGDYTRSDRRAQAPFPVKSLDAAVTLTLTVEAAPRHATRRRRRSAGASTARNPAFPLRR